jgi:Rrf2 family protein
MLALAATPEAQLTSAVLAGRTAIPASYVPQVMGDLVRAGLVANRRGRLGGYRLGRSPSEISLLAIVEAIEGDGRRTTCVLRGGPCGRPGTCDVHHAFVAAQDAMFGSLGAVSLADVVR